MKSNTFKLGFIVTICLLFICISISPSIIGNFEKNSNLSISSYPENLGLSAYWSFDEGSGNLAYDYSGHGYHGTINGASWITGHSGYALDFDGEANNVNLDTYSIDLGFNKTDDYIISAWINSESTESGVIYMISYSSPMPIFYIKFNFDGTLQMKVQSTDSCGLIVNSTDSYNDGLWHYIEGRYYGDITNPTMELYVDSLLVGNDSQWLCPMVSFQFKKAKIGMATYDSEFFDGIIDEVKVFKIPGGNKAPNTPVISGPTSGYVGDDYNYTFITTDNEGDDLYIWIDWGDNTNTGWIGPYNSSEEVKLSPSWSENGVYNIKAKAKDVRGHESGWSDSFVVAITKKTIIMGFITDKNSNGELTFIKAKFLIYIGLNPFNLKFYSSQEEIVISKKYSGLLGQKFISGIFDAIVI